MSEYCGTYTIDVKDTKAYQVRYIDEDEPKNGVQLSQKSKKTDPTTGKTEVEELEFLKVQAYYLDYPELSLAEIIHQAITIVECFCDDGFTEEPVNITIPTTMKLDLTHSFVAPSCRQESDGCMYAWKFDLQAQNATQKVNSTLFTLDPDSGELKIKSSLMDHKAANHFALNIVVYNDVPNPLTQNFTIQLDVHEELFETNGKVYIIDTIQEKPLA